MTKLKRIIALGTMVLVIGATSVTAFAASKYSTPAEAIAGLTGKTAESITAEREAGKTYGMIADEAGKLTEFKAEMIEIKKDALAQKVAAGTMTQEKADEILAAIEKKQANCDAAGSGKMGRKLGEGFSGMNRKGQGEGQGKGQGIGRGQGRGQCGVGLNQAE